MSVSPSVPPPSKLTLVHWLILIIAAVGFAFDIYELLMLPLIIKPALQSLGGSTNGVPNLLPGTPEYVAWARTLFFVPALAGGVFGLLGGYLTDLLGRRRVLTGSILLYAISALAAGYATNLYALLGLRCLVFIGVCVEFVAAVAWLAELFPNPHQRETVLGYTQAFSSFGGLLVGVAAKLASGNADSLWAIHGGHEAWRYTLISGVIPAIPLILIRPFLPESPAWAAKKAEGRLKRPSIAELFNPQLMRTTVLTTLIFASSYGIAFGAIQQLPQILQGHEAIKALGEKAQADEIEKAKSAGKPAPKQGRLNQVAGNVKDEAVSEVTIWQEVGGLFGRFALALLALKILSRRTLLRIFQIPALLYVPVLFWLISTALPKVDSLDMIKYGIFVAGFLTVAQFSFWGNYIPLVFPVHLRGTGESFAANIGGRVIGTAAAYLTLTFSAMLPLNVSPPAKLAIVGAIVAGAYALIGTLLTQWLPEPSPEAMDE